MTLRLVILAASIALAGGCKDNEDLSGAKAPSDSKPNVAAPAERQVTGGLMADEDSSGIEEEAERDLAPAKKVSSRTKNKKGRGFGKGGSKGAAKDEAGPGGGSERGAQSRSWFPETFLFEPLVVTDANGVASVNVTVPDRLTSWRVLALAHSRNGSQAGATTQFLGTLPAYVDPILPSRLRVGDRLRVPVQLVNTTSKPIRSELTMSASGGRLSAPPSSVSIPARGSLLVYATLAVPSAGQVKLVASLSGADSVVRTAEVVPVGKRLDAKKSATLAAPRALRMDGPGTKDAPDRVRLEVFPGALAVLRSELGSAVGRGGIAEDSFSLLLAGQAPALLSKLGDEPNADALRTMTILATQRIVRHARVLNSGSATLVARAALAHPQNAILEALGRRAVAYLEANQLPDGTCGGETGWTLQRLLVATADCARAGSDARAVVVRASGAFERHQKHINDPFTAAAVLAAGGAPDEQLATKLQTMVRESVERSDTGLAWIKLPEGVVRADGRRPSVVEASALAVLALADTPADKNLVADLGATVLAGYSRRVGWGDGRANLIAIEALVRVFDKPVPENIKIELSKGSEVIASGKLSAENLRDVLVLEAKNVGVAGPQTWSVKATPNVAGLGFNLETSAWVAWPPAERSKGLELEAKPPTELATGQLGAWRIDAAAPANLAFSITLRAPAGVQFDRQSLDELARGASVSRYQLDDDQLTLHVTPLQPGQAFGAEIRIIPTIAGSLSTGAQTITAGTVEVAVPPVTWVVK